MRFSLTSGLLAALMGFSAHAASVIGTRTPVIAMSPCQTTYRCTLKPAGTSGTYTRSTLRIQLRKPSPDAYADTWELTTFSKDGTNVGLGWHVAYQDDFYFPETETMLLAVSNAYLGQRVPKEALARIVRNAMGAYNDPAKSSVRSAQFVIDSVSGSVANARTLDVYFTSLSTHDALRAVEPPRLTMTAPEKRMSFDRIRTAVNAFEGDPSLCDRFPHAPGFAVLFPGGGAVTWKSLDRIMTQLGFINSGGARYIAKYPASTFFLLENGNDFCVTAD